MQYDHKVTGRVIRRLRKKKGLSQDVLSGLAGIERTHLTKIELGTKSANPETLWKVADALDVRLSDIFRLVEEEIDKTN